MNNQTYLVRRGSIYYCRIRIPRDLLEAFHPRTELKLSLRTSVRLEAIVACQKCVIRFHQTFDALREQLRKGGLS